MYYPHMGLAYSVFLHSSLWVVVCRRFVFDPDGPGYRLWGWRRKKCVRIKTVVMNLMFIGPCSIVIVEE
jgi:hypothetical protein